MKKILDFLFIGLLLTYPFINMLPKELNKIGFIWGGISSIFIFLFFIFKTRTIHRYVLSAILISIFILISIVLSNEVSFLKLSTGYKYVLPLLLASYIYYYPLSEKRLLIIYKVLFLYLMLMLILFVYRLSYIEFNPLLITAYKDFVWYGKSHNFAQMYLILSVSFLFFSYLLKKNLSIAYLFFLPILFIGVRSVLLGIISFLVVFLFKSIFRKCLKFIVISILITLTLIYVQPDFKKFYPLILSAQDATRGADKMTLTSMSSGRDIILEYYINALNMDKIFFGSGLQYLEKDAKFKFGLHNDTLEFFFSFGIFGLIALVFGIYYLIFYDAFKNTHGVNRRFILSLMVLFFSVSGFAFFLYNQLIVYLFILIYIIKRYPVPNNGHKYVPR